MPSADLLIPFFLASAVFASPCLSKSLPPPPLILPSLPRAVIA